MLWEGLVLTGLTHESAPLPGGLLGTVLSMMASSGMALLRVLSFSRLAKVCLLDGHRNPENK